MLENLLIALETLLLFLYPMQKTVKLWRTEPINTVAYQESLAYWILYSTTLAGRWIFPVLWYTIARQVLLLLIMFALPVVTKFLFKFSKEDKIKDS